MTKCVAFGRPCLSCPKYQNWATPYSSCYVNSHSSSSIGIITLPYWSILGKSNFLDFFNRIDFNYNFFFKGTPLPSTLLRLVGSLPWTLPSIRSCTRITRSRLCITESRVLFRWPSRWPSCRRWWPDVLSTFGLTKWVSQLKSKTFFYYRTPGNNAANWPDCIVKK